MYSKILSVSKANLAFSKSKAAFTLAEVLITLAIIGVVAAITLPTLIQKHQKKVLATNFQVAISTLQNGFKKMMADEEVMNFEDTDLNRYCNNFQNHDKCISIMNKYFKVAEIKHYEDEQHTNCDTDISKGMAFDALINGHDCNYFLFGNGEFYYILQNGVKVLYQYNEAILIDTNGNRGPNVGGRDVFLLGINSKGQLKGIFSRDYDDVAEEYLQLKANYEQELKRAEESNPNLSPEEHQEMVDDIYRQIFNDTDFTITPDIDQLKHACQTESITGCADYLMANGYKMDY